MELRETERLSRLEPFRLYTTREVEAVTGFKSRTLQAYIRQGRLRGRKIGGLWKVTAEALKDFLDQTEETTKAPI